MNYTLANRDGGNPPMSIKQQVTLVWTHPPVMEYQRIMDKMRNWLPLMAKYGTVVVSRFDYENELTLFEAVRDAVVHYTHEGDLVVDPFCGRSTTGVAAIKNLRNYLGLDTNQAAISLSEDRLCQLP